MVSPELGHMGLLGLSQPVRRRRKRKAGEEDRDDKIKA